MYRVDSSRPIKGHGLGLSFAKAIVNAHGGAINVSSELDAGTNFTITLPSN